MSTSLRAGAWCAALLFLLATAALASDAVVEQFIREQEALLKAGEKERMLAQARARVEKEDTAVHRYLLGRAYGMTGDLEKAREQFDWALERDAASAYAYHGIGAYHLMKGNLEEAERYLRNAIRLDPKLTRAHVELGKLYLTRQDRLAAQREFLAVLDYEPDNVDVRLLLAYQYLRDKRWERAMREFVAVLSKDAENAAAHKGHGIALAYQKRTDEAIREFRWVLERDPRDLDSYIFLTNLLRTNGDRKGAIEVLSKLLKQVPEKSPIADSVRQEIENIREGRTPGRGAVTVPILLEQLDSEDVDVRREAMGRLVELGLRPPPRRMVRAVMDADPVVRTLAVRNLGEVGGRHVIPLLEIMLHHPRDAEKNERVRGAVARALGRTGEPAAIPVLLASLSEEEDYVFQAAVASLRELTGLVFTPGSTGPVPKEKKAEVAGRWRAWWRGPRSFSKKLAAIESMVELDARRMAAYLVECLGDEERVAAKARDAFTKLMGVVLGTAEDVKSREGRERLMKEAALVLATGDRGEKTD